MSATVFFDSVNSPFFGSELSFSVQTGELAVLLTAKEEVNAALVRLLFGVNLPLAGSVSVLGEAIASLDESLLFRLRSRMGLVFSFGGLISNLKVGENLYLPLQYHKLPVAEESAAAGEAILQRVGYRGGSSKLPGLLSQFEKKQVLLARVILMNPEVVIYDSLLLGHNLHERNHLLDIAVDFHREMADRTSIFLSSDASLPQLMHGAKIIAVH